MTMISGTAKLKNIFWLVQPVNCLPYGDDSNARYSVPGTLLVTIGCVSDGKFDDARYSGGVPGSCFCERPGHTPPPPRVVVAHLCC